MTQENGDCLPLLDAFFMKDVVSYVILAWATSTKLHLARNRNETGIYWLPHHQSRHFREKVEPSKKNHSPKIWKYEGTHCKRNRLKSIYKRYWLHINVFFMLHKLKVLDSNNNENLLKNCILYFFTSNRFCYQGNMYKL